MNERHNKEMLKKLIQCKYPKSIVNRIYIFRRECGEYSFKCNINNSLFYMSSLPNPLRTYCYRQLNKTKLEKEI